MIRCVVHAAPTPDTMTASLRGALRAAGLRATSSRIAVLRALRTAQRPLSHADLVKLLDGQSFNRATLYRNLTDLVEAGLARRAELGDHVWRFEGKGTSEHDTRAHPHFVCVECGTVECLPEMAVELPASASAPQAVRRHEIDVQVRGLCNDCD